MKLEISRSSTTLVTTACAKTKRIRSWKREKNAISVGLKPKFRVPFSAILLWRFVSPNLGRVSSWSLNQCRSPHKDLQLCLLRRDNWTIRSRDRGWGSWRFQSIPWLFGSVGSSAVVRSRAGATGYVAPTCPRMCATSSPPFSRSLPHSSSLPFSLALSLHLSLSPPLVLHETEQSPSSPSVPPLATFWLSSGCSSTTRPCPKPSPGRCPARAGPPPSSCSVSASRWRREGVKIEIETISWFQMQNAQRHQFTYMGLIN